MNMYDATALTITFPSDLGGLLKDRQLQVPSASIRARAHANASATSAHSQGGPEKVVVARCWALHDACLTDPGSDATTSPSCPDHTALNSPATSSPLTTSSGGTEATAATAAGGRAPEDLEVVLSRVPPEWSRAERVVRYAPPRPLSHHQPVDPAGSSEARLQSKAERKERRRREKKRAAKGNPPRTEPAATASVGAENPAVAQDTAHEDGSAFRFYGSVTLLPLSVTVCELVLDDDDAQQGYGGGLF